MKVLLIDVNCKYSSTGKIVYDLYHRLREDGHEAAICYGRGELIKEAGIYKFGLDWETYLHAGLARITGLNGYYSHFSTRRLINFIKAFQPDVIHIHELHAYFVNIKPLVEYIKKKGIKTIWTFHCEYMYTGKCGHANDCMNFVEKCGNCPAVREYPKSLFLDCTSKMLRDKRKMLEDWDFTIVTPSQWLADRVKMSFLKSKRIEVIHNGIDTENIFYPRNEEEVNAVRKKYGLEGKKVILSVAPNIMDERKGGKVVVEISRGLKEYVFLLVGADKTFVDENRIFIEETSDQNELAALYSAANVFLICSKKENFPTTCIESFCCGTPVVGVDAGGTCETVAEPYGVFVRCNITDIGKAIVEMMKNDFNRNDMKQLSHGLYSRNLMYENYKKLYTWEP